MFKKIVLSILLCIFIGALAYSDVFDFINHGEYAFYLDKRGGKDFIRGYCCLKVDNGSNYFLIRNIDQKSNKQINFIVILETDNKGQPTIKEIHGLGQDTPPEFTQSYIDILNYTTLFKNHEDEIKYDTDILDPWENYTLIFKFNLVYPLFRIVDITMQGENKPSYTYGFGGMFQGDDFNDFFEMELNFYRENKASSHNVPTIETIDTIDVELNGITVTLDERWKFNDELGFPGYWLNIQTKRDSQLMVERGSWNKFKSIGITSLDDFILKAIFSGKNKIIADTIVTKEIKNGIHLEYKLLDDNGVTNFTRLIAYIENNELVIINFSSFDDIYQNNSEYYKKILNSIEY
jgi:hypothetical protein